MFFFSFFLVCVRRIDLGFVLDVTYRVSQSNIKHIRTFVKEVTRRFQLSSRYTRVGVIVYTSRPRLLVGLTTRNGNVRNVLGRIRIMRGRRQTGRALTYAKNVFFRRRPECGRKRVLVIVTGGYSVDNVVKPSRDLQNNGVEIYAVMTNSRVHTQFRKALTTRQHSIVVSYKQMIKIVSGLSNRICHSPRG